MSAASHESASCSRGHQLPLPFHSNQGLHPAGKEIALRNIFDTDFPKDPVIYLDTEFTDLDAPELLSIGLVNGQGDEFYVELDLDSPEGASAQQRISSFVRENGVLDQFGHVRDAKASYAEMARRVKHWLQEQLDDATDNGSRQVVLAVDFDADFELLERLLSQTGHWAELRRRVRPINVSELTGRFGGLLAAGAAYEQLRRRGLERHHALADAHALRAAYISLQTGKRVRL